MKHKHYEMIVAKAANMDLVVFIKDSADGELKWRPMISSIPVNENVDYFLCLPQHRDAVLNSLNGGISQTWREDKGWWGEAYADTFDKWNSSFWYMDKSRKSRIKPKKEKRMIVVNGDHVEFALTERLYPESAQFIEIEVEV